MGLKSGSITSLTFGGGQAGRPVLLAGDGDRGGGVRVIGVLLEGDAEGALADTGLVRLEGGASPGLGDGARIIGRLGVDQTALGFTGQLELPERAAGVTGGQFQVGFELDRKST